MKILDDIKKIVEKHEIKNIDLPDGYKNIYEFLRDIPEFSDDFKPQKDDFYFLRKYSKHIAKGHYGFSIGHPTNPKWCEAIDEIIEYCILIDPKFEIMQIKIKFGFLCFYVSSAEIEDIHEIEVYLAKTLSDKALIY